jgi:hypothetical protein
VATTLVRVAIHVVFTRIRQDEEALGLGLPLPDGRHQHAMEWSAYVSVGTPTASPGV